MGVVSMSRLVAVVLALLVAVVAPAPLSGQTSVDGVIADLDGFWAGTFAAAGIPYASPAVVALDGPLDTPCGPIEPAWGPAAYCAVNQTIYYSPQWFGVLSAGEDGLAGVTILAHEWGHHVQLQLGLLGSPTAESELQADCLAGVYAQDAEARGIISGLAIAEAMRVASLSGDLGWLPVDAPAHGSGAERAISFMNGYRDGAPGCGITL
jgi:predicted metalloprotease